MPIGQILSPSDASALSPRVDVLETELTTETASRDNQINELNNILDNSVRNDINIGLQRAIYVRTTNSFDTTSMSYLTVLQAHYFNKNDVISLNAPDGFGVITYIKIGEFWEVETAFTTDDVTILSGGLRYVNIRKTDSSALTADEVNVITLHRKSYNHKQKEYVESYTRFTVNTNVHAYVSKDNSSISNQDIYQSRDLTCVLALPQSYAQFGEPTPIVMMCHGFSGQVSDTSWYNNNVDFLALVSALTNAGYAVFDVDNTEKSPTGGICDVGCPQLLEAYTKAFEHIKKYYNVQDKCLVYGMSHGTFTALNILKMYNNLVKCAVIAGPVVSYKYVWDQGSFVIPIAKKFGFEDQTGATYEVDKLVGYDTFADLTTIVDKDYLFKSLPPIKWLFGGNDLGTYANTMKIINALKNGGNVAYYRTVEGQDHHQITNSAQEGLRAEVIMFYDRFR